MKKKQIVASYPWYLPLVEHRQFIVPPMPSLLGGKHCRLANMDTLGDVLDFNGRFEGLCIDVIQMFVTQHRERLVKEVEMVIECCEEWFPEYLLHRTQWYDPHRLASTIFETTMQWRDECDSNVVVWSFHCQLHPCGRLYVRVI